jgi:hypothetical protein
MNAICLVMDRLHAGYVGAYGNSWIETPSLDRLATQAFLLDRHWLDCPQLELLYRSYWLGRHALELQEEDARRRPLPELLSARGVATTLVSDDPVVLAHPLAQGFGQRLELPAPQSIGLASQWDETHLAHCFAQWIGWLEQATEPFFLWCHLGSLGMTWDAPYELRAHYAADEDPEPPAGAEVPLLVLEEDYDPDQLLGITQSYAGQVTLLDTCLGVLLDWLEDSEVGKKTQFTLMSSRGFPLGEHRRVGGDEAIYGELLHVPVLLRFPDGEGMAARSQALTQPADLWATLVDWWGLREQAVPSRGQSLLPLVRGDVTQIRDRLCVTGQGGQHGIITPAWYGRFAEKPEVYLKPDDRWEFNDVSARCPEIVDLLQEAQSQCERQLRFGEPAELAPLEPRLVHGVE